MAKSTTVVALIKVLHDMTAERKIKNKAITVVAYRIEELVALYTLATSLGVSPDFIGLKYKVTPATIKAGIPAPVSDEDATTRPVILATHARVYVSGKTADAAKKASAVDMYLAYRGKRRHLVIWDETLTKSDARTVDLSAVEIQLPSFVAATKRAKQPSTVQGAVRYLNEVMGLFQDEINRQRAGKNTAARPVAVPRISPDIMDSYVSAVRKTGGNVSGKRGVAVSAIVDTLELCRNEVLRVVATDQGAVVSYLIAVPVELDRVVVLDAGWTLNKLMERDKSFTRDLKFEALAKGAKRYDDCTLTRIPAAAGKTKYIELFSKPDINDRLPSLEAASIINQDIPAGEKVLVITHKGIEETKTRKGLDIPAILAEDLKALCGPDILDRVAITSWGKHRAVNEYRDTPNVIHLGMSYRSEDSITGDAIGLSDDLAAPLTQDDVNGYTHSETADKIMQGLSRGSSRVVYVDKWGRSQAMRSRIWQTLHEPQPFDIVIEHCPGMTLAVQEPRYLAKADREWTATAVSKLVLDFLDKAEGTTSVSVRRLRTALDLTDCPQRTWNRAVADAVAYCGEIGWTKRDRGFIRTR